MVTTVLLTGGILFISGCSSPTQTPDYCLYLTERERTATQDWEDLRQSTKLQSKIQQPVVKVKQLWPIHPIDLNESNIPKFLKDPAKWYLYRDNEWEVYAISTNKGN